MAEFHVNGIEDVEGMFDQLANIPAGVLRRMIKAQEKVVIEAQQAGAPKDTGSLKDSIGPSKEVFTTDGIVENIYPQGIHHTSKRSRYRQKAGSGRSVRNAEVGFIHEFGAPGRNIKASQWMRKANEKSSDETTAAGQEEFNNWVDTL